MSILFGQLSILSFSYQFMSIHRTFYQSIDFIYYCCPDYWKFRKNCKIVHEFAMKVIKQRRKELEESKVCCVT